MLRRFFCSSHKQFPVTITSASTKSLIAFRFQSTTPNYETRLFINGEFISSNVMHEIKNPATDKKIIDCHFGNQEHIDLAVKSAHSAFENKWKYKSGSQRRDALLKLADAIEEPQNLKELAALETLNNGKPLAESESDVIWSAKCFRYFASLGSSAFRGHVLPNESHHVFAYNKYEPIGVAALIVPFNYSILMAAWKISPCLAAGCTFVLKPSPETPLTMLKMAQIVQERNIFPNGVFNVVPGDGAVTGQALVEHPLVDKVSFTGSTETGKKIGVACALQMKRTTMELGGKSPLVICEDYNSDKNLDDIISDWVVPNIFGNQGQICSACSRIFVHESLRDRFLEKIKKAAEELKQGDGSLAETTIGPQISRRQQEKVYEFIRQGLAHGKTKSITGCRFGDPEKDLPEHLKKLGGYFVPPTILLMDYEGADENPCVENEIFGPVSSVLCFKTVDEVIVRCNNTWAGLVAGIFTHDSETQAKFVNEVKAGTIYVNCFGAVDNSQEFGGYKYSGYGRDLGESAMKAYCEVKSVAQNYRGVRLVK